MRCPRRIRLHALLIGSSLALGLVTTVAIAWLVPVPSEMSMNSYRTGAYRRNNVVKPFSHFESPTAEWAFRVYKDVPASETKDIVRGYQYASDGTLPINPATGQTVVWTGEHYLKFPSPAWGTAREPTMFQLALGWPCKCLYAEWSAEDQPRFSLACTTLSLRGPHSLVGGLTGKHPLPYFPLWPNLLANTVVYAGAWLLLLASPAALLALRRQRRRARGLCTLCGYDTSASSSAPCPECGNPAS